MNDVERAVEMMKHVTGKQDFTQTEFMLGVLQSMYQIVINGAIECCRELQDEKLPDTVVLSFIHCESIIQKLLTKMQEVTGCSHDEIPLFEKYTGLELRDADE